VIGFSLAQVSLNLVLPSRASELYTHPTGIFAFAVTFAIVSGVWYSHNRLFADFFVPTPVAVFLNFVLLGFTLLLVYMLQVFTHFERSSDLASEVGYMACFAIVYGLLAVLYAMGLRRRWVELDPKTRQRGILASARATMVAIVLLVGCPVAYALKLPLVTAVLAILPFALLARILNARYGARLAGSAEAS